MISLLKAEGPDMALAFYTPTGVVYLSIWTPASQLPLDRFLVLLTASESNQGANVDTAAQGLLGADGCTCLDHGDMILPSLSLIHGLKTAPTPTQGPSLSVIKNPLSPPRTHPGSHLGQFHRVSGWPLPVPRDQKWQVYTTLWVWIRMCSWANVCSLFLPSLSHYLGREKSSLLFPGSQAEVGWTCSPAVLHTWDTFNQSTVSATQTQGRSPLPSGKW